MSHWPLASENQLVFNVLFLSFHLYRLIYDTLTSNFLSVILDPSLDNLPPYSWGNNVGNMLTLAPERYTAGLYMITKIIL